MNSRTLGVVICLFLAVGAATSTLENAPLEKEESPAVSGSSGHDQMTIEDYILSQLQDYMEGNSPHHDENRRKNENGEDAQKDSETTATSQRLFKQPADKEKKGHNQKSDH